MVGKINSKLEFLYRKQSFLDSSLRRLLLSALVQPEPLCLILVIFSKQNDAKSQLKLTACVCLACGGPILVNIPHMWYGGQFSLRMFRPFFYNALN